MASGLLELPESRPMLDAASNEGADLRTALAGDDDALRPTEIAQPALLFTECALLRLLPGGLDVAGCAGHSVGEYAAAVAAGALSPEQAMRIVVRRGRAMAGMRQGGMTAVIGLGAEKLADICRKVSDETGETVVIANLNAPGQVVISGTVAGVEEAARRAREAGAKRALPLNVSGAFHSPLMVDAAASVGEALDEVQFSPLALPVVCNVDAEAVTETEELRLRLRLQLTSPVRWVDCVRTLRRLGADTIVEVGPGSVLTGLVRRIDPEMQTLNVRTPDEAATLAAAVA